MTMTIQGNNNKQVSGNLTENHYHGKHDGEIPLDHPHRVICPQCNQATLRFMNIAETAPAPSAFASISTRSKGKS